MPKQQYKRQADFARDMNQSSCYIGQLIREGKLTTKDIAGLKVIPLTPSNIQAATRRTKQPLTPSRPQ